MPQRLLNSRSIAPSSRKAEQIASSPASAQCPHTASEVLPADELHARHTRCRDLLEHAAPDASGMLVFSRVSIYYLTGTLGNGVFWLPKTGNPVLLVRHGLERCRLESPLEHIIPYRSYSELVPRLTDAGCPPGPVVAAEFSGLTWQFASMLQARMPNTHFVPCDTVLSDARSVKSPWELTKLRLAGARHHQSLYHDLPRLIRPGMTERDISHLAWQVFFRHGHAGIMRMNSFGEEIFLGHICAGENGNYPSHFNGPLGVKGEHPAAPYMGYAGAVWCKGMPLSVDIGFNLEGYNTDKTQVYWAGPASTIPDTIRRAHDTCVAIQHHAATRLIPGAIPSEIYGEALAIAEQAGFSDGFMGLGNNKVPFLGHSIGLGVDEQPVIANRFDSPLAEHMVFAVEPKIGIPGVGMVGVENTFVVTASGADSLTGNEYDICCVE